MGWEGCTVMRSRAMNLASLNLHSGFLIETLLEHRIIDTLSPVAGTLHLYTPKARAMQILTIHDKDLLGMHLAHR